MKVKIIRNHFNILDNNSDNLFMVPTKKKDEVVVFGPDYPVYFLNEVKYQAIEIIPNEKPLLPTNDISILAEYRDYQEKAVWSATKSPRGYFELPTGSGKTIIMAGIIKLFGIPPTLILAPSVDLCKQLRDRFENLLNEWVGLYSHNFKSIKPITVSTYSSFIKSPDKFSDFKMLLIDEAHHLTGIQLLSRVLLHPAIHKYGFSSTIETDWLTAKYVRITLSGYFDRLVIGDRLFRMTLEDADEFFPKINLRLIPLIYDYNPLPDWIDTNSNLYYTLMVSKNRKRNEAIANEIAEIINEVNPVLILTAQLRQAKQIAETLKKHLGFNIPIINSATKKAERETIINSINDFKCVIATSIWDEGIDIPDIRCIVIASSQSSPIKAIQRIGRGLRKTKEKDEILVVDFIDQCDLVLYRRDMKRVETYARFLPLVTPITERVSPSLFPIIQLCFPKKSTSKITLQLASLLR